MNNNTIQGSWNEIKGKIKTQWAKLNDDDVEALKGNLDQLAGKIQKVYGYGKDQAELEFKKFKNSLTSKTNDAIEAVNEKLDQVTSGAEVISIDKNKK